MVMAEKYGIGSAPITPQMFASAGIEHMEKYGNLKLIDIQHVCLLQYKCM
jgi:hypothetical protein